MTPTPADQDRHRPPRGVPPLVVAAAALVAVALGVAVVLAFRGGDDGVTRIDPGAQGQAGGDPAPQPADVAGEPLPDVAFERFDGTTASLGQYVGRPLVINFFAYWCAPCRAEMPDLQQVYEQVGDRVAFLGLDYLDQPERGQRLVEETGITYDVGQDRDGEVLDAVGGVSMPTTVLVTADGTIAAVHSGKLDAAQLTQLIDDHLPA